MEFHERMAIAHTFHTFWNPVSEDVVDELIWALDPEPGARVLDIACGAGELLLRLAATCEIEGVGVDVSSRALERARETHAQRIPDARLTFVEGPGEDYRAPDGQAFDIVSLMGASWIFAGYAGTLRALHDFVKPDGKVLFGEPFWRTDVVSPEYLAGEGVTRESFTDLAGLDEAVQAAGFRMLYLVVSSGQDWDRYEMLQSLSVDGWAAEHPDHVDRDEVLAIQAQARSRYLRWGRDTLGFAQMILRRVD